MRFQLFSGRPAAAVALLFFASALPTPSLGAQAPARPAGLEVRLLAAGWSAIAEGDAAGASRVAAELAGMPSSRSSDAAVAFLVEAALLGADHRAGLAAYERWLDGRSAEAPYTVRRLALAVLREAGANASPVQMQALGALARSGDATAGTQLATATARGDLEAAIIQAAAGQDEAIDTLVERIGRLPAGQDRAIDALAASGSRRAVPALIGLLSDSRDTVRADAARALGRLSAREAAPELRGLLEHHYPAVRLAAAEALYTMGDDSGRPVLEQFATSEHAGVRVAAAEAMASRPDAGWILLVSGLATDGDPVIRLRAARLLAPHNPDAAGSIMAALLADSNPAVREAAGLASASDTSDFTALRRLLSGPDPGARVRAATRVLELTQ
jgi:hypothetical protein